MKNLNIPPVSKNLLGWVAVGAGVIAALSVVPRSIFNFKPIQRFEEKTSLSILADSKTGDLFTWIPTEDGKAFVRLDKNSESKYAKEEPNTEEEPAEIASADVRSGRIFKVSDTYGSGNSKLNVNAQIKYRRKEGRMLYRVSFAPVLPEGKKCPSAAQETNLKTIYDAAKKNTLRFRFADSQDFWIQDLITPLSSDVANNKITTVIDSVKGDCKQIKELVFHGRAKNFSLPDFQWIENGKLLFSGVKVNK